MKKRIWELDALRGLDLLVMIGLHLTYDLVFLFNIWKINDFTAYNIIQKCCAITFLVLSGLCVTLGKRPIRRGLLVLGCGTIISAVTVGMYLLQFTGKDIIIYFGVLHCLGICMMLWPAFRKCPVWVLAVLGIAMIAGGLYLVEHVQIAGFWLTPFGVPGYGFSSSDYFPLLPNLGYFLLGAALGKTLYRNKQSLLPCVNEKNIILRFLCWCGRKSLWIYMIHQPVLAAAVGLYVMLSA